MRRSGRRGWTWALVAALPAVSLLAQQPPTPAPPPATPPSQPATPSASQPQTPVFRSSVDLVVVEATVVDKSGAIVKGLQPADFTVEIGGKAREVVSADLVEYQTSVARPVSPDITTNTASVSGRTIVIVIDQSSLSSDSRSVIEGVRRWIDTLPPGDRVGLVSLPPPGPRVEFTTEHARVREAVGRVVTVSAFTPPSTGTRNVGIWEALRISDGDTSVRRDVVARECSATDIQCPDDVDMIARDLSQDAMMRIRPVLSALSGLMTGLGQLPGPKHMVLLTSGWAIDERNAGIEMAPIAAEAARSNVTVHTFSAEKWAMSASNARPSMTQSQDTNLLLSSVEMLAGYTGGRSARLTGTGEGALKSLTDGLTGYYRLGVRPAPEDLDGKTRRISMKLTRPGASLRGYRRVMAGMRPASEKPPVDAETAIRDALKSATTSAALDLRSTTYVMHGENASMDTVRVVVLGDVMRASAGPATATAVLYDAQGKPVTSGRSIIEVPAGEAPAMLQTALTVKPGAYLLRVAVRDADGKIGTIERGVDAKWIKTGGVETTGMVLFRQSSSGSSTEPIFETVSTAEQVIVQLAIHTPPTPLPEVVVELHKENVPAPLLKGPARVAKSTAGATLAQYVVPMALLPPGRYTVSAAIGQGKTTPFTRSFTLAAVSATPESGETTTAVSRSAPSMSALLSLARPARFASASVLDPSFVEPVMTRLAGRPEAAAVRDAIDHVKAGPWPTDSTTGPLASAPMAASFVAGLGRLQAGDLEAAANEFRTVLRLAPDFAPAMIYLGACYAAGSKDKEAASAWQTALLRERESPTLLALAIDGWMRAGRPAAALTLLKSARTRWPDDPTFRRQQAQATLADGRTRDGIELVMALPEPGESLLFFSLGALYHAAVTKTPVWDAERDRKTLRDLREAYAKANGASLALVDVWIAEVESAR